MKRRKRNEQRTVQQKISTEQWRYVKKRPFFHMATQVTHQNLSDKTTTNGINTTCCSQIGE